MRANAANNVQLTTSQAIGKTDREWFNAGIMAHGLTPNRAIAAIEHHVHCTTENCPEIPDWEQVRALLEGGPH